MKSTDGFSESASTVSGLYKTTSKYRVKMLKTISNFISPKCSLHDDIRNYNFPCNSKTRMLLALPDRVRVWQNADLEPSVSNIFSTLNTAVHRRPCRRKWCDSDSILFSLISDWSSKGTIYIFMQSCSKNTAITCYNHYYMPATLSRCQTSALFRANIAQ